MHELGITQSLIDIAIEYAQGAKVTKITLEIGILTAVLPDAIAFCFDACSLGTILEGAALNIVKIPGLGRCRQCGAEVFVELPFGVCSCGSLDLDLIHGQELQLKELETEDLCV